LKSLKKKITALEKEVVELSTSKSSLKAKLEQTETDLKNS
jgi:phage shock protein A